MCRQGIITATDVSGTVKLQVLHHLASAAMATDNVREGWGVANMSKNKLFKGSGHYITSDVGWYEHITSSLDDADVIGFHLRNSSAGTSVTSKESQPFVFTAHDDTINFIGMHNGTIAKSWAEYKNVPNAPNSDSFRAFSRLHTLLQNRDSIGTDADVVEEWLSVYEDTSTFAFIMQYKNDLVVLRNKAKDLYAVTFGNGYILCTSAAALMFTCKASKLYGWDIPWGDSLIEVETDNLIHFTPGSQECRAENVHLKMQHGTTTTVYSFRGGASYSEWSHAWDDASKNSNDEKPEAQTKTQVGTRNDTHTQGSATSQTALALYKESPEEVHQWTSLVAQAPKDDAIDTIIDAFRGDDRSRIISSIRATLNPMREPMIALYASLFVNGDDIVGLVGKYVVPARLENIDTTTLVLFDNNVPALTKEQKVVINAYNRKVKPANDLNVLENWFGANLPHLLPYRVAMSLIESIGDQQ